MQENCQKNLSAKRRGHSPLLSQKETWKIGESQGASKGEEEGEEEEVVVEDADEATAVAEVQDVEQEAMIMAQAKLAVSAETEDGKNYGRSYLTWTRK